MIVIDASALVEYLFASRAGERIGERLVDPEEELAAPCLLDVEVAQVIRRWSLAGLVDEERAAKALADLSDLNALRWPHEPLLTRIWALRHNFTAYDAAYIALAESLGATLLTCDRSLANGGTVGCTIDLVE